MSKTYSCLLFGVDVHTVEIETVMGSGFSGLNILGLPSDATRDMRERVRSALESIGIPIPARRVVVNVSSVETIKLSRTSLVQLDFAVAACIIRALFDDNEDKTTLFQPEQEFLAGELSLSAELKPIANPLIYEAIGAAKNSKIAICLPYNEEQFHPSFEYYKNLKDWFDKRKYYKNKVSEKVVLNTQVNIDNVNRVTEKKLNDAKSTIEILLKNPKICVSLLIAAAGGHNLLIAGEPGIGKSFSIKKLHNLLLPLKDKEKIEVRLIHGAADVNERPFRFPHHSCTAAALVGGSSLKPGEVTLAHHGVLFLDELAEFPRSSLEALREPLDSGCVTLSRANGNILYPAKFQLCATTNPCPCGYMFSRKKPCRCNPTESKKYLQKISGPLLDRFCLQIWIDSAKEEDKGDIFSNYINKIVEKNKLNSFIEYFFKVQEEIPGGEGKPEQIQIECDFSLRGKEKISKIAYTFSKVFPELKGDKKFLEDVFTYRVLMGLFNRNLR